MTRVYAVVEELRKRGETTARCLPGNSSSNAMALRHARARGQVTSRKIGRDVYWKVNDYPNGRPMFAPNGTMLDENGNRSIFDDVDE